MFCVLQYLARAVSLNSLAYAVEIEELGPGLISDVSFCIRFLRAVERLYLLCLGESRIDDLCNIILLVNLFRVIQCTSMHPRLNLLLGTLKVDVHMPQHALAAYMSFTFTTWWALNGVP